MIIFIPVLNCIYAWTNLSYVTCKLYVLSILIRYVFKRFRSSALIRTTTRRLVYENIQLLKLRLWIMTRLLFHGVDPILLRYHRYLRCHKWGNQWFMWACQQFKDVLNESGQRYQWFIGTLNQSWGMPELFINALNQLLVTPSMIHVGFGSWINHAKSLKLTCNCTACLNMARSGDFSSVSV